MSEFAEQAVLACVMLKPALLDRVDLPPEAFLRPRFRQVYEAMLKLQERKLAADAVLIAGVLTDGGMEKQQAVMLVALIFDGWAHTRGFEHYVAEMRESAYRARLEEIESLTKLDAANPLLTPDAIEEFRSDRVRQARLAYGIGSSIETAESSTEQLRSFYRTYDQRAIPTGFRSLDNQLGEIHPGSVLTILARPGIGKSNIGLNLVANWLALCADWGSLFYSLEMPSTLATARIIRIVEGWSRYDLRHKMLSGVEPKQFLSTGDRYALAAKGAMTVGELEQNLDRAGRLLGKPIRACVVDYFQYLRGSAGKQSAYERASMLSGQLKELAKDRDCLVVLLSQVGRGEAGGGGYGCPSLEAARDSGTIEENADFLLGLWRPDRAPNFAKSGEPHMLGKLCIRILKGRNGGQGHESVLGFDEDSLRMWED